MPNALIRIPLQRVPTTAGYDAYRIKFLLDICGNRAAKSAHVGFRLDSGTDFTTIPIEVATRLGISFTKARPVHPNTAAGKAKLPSYLSPIHFSLPGLPQYDFTTECLFSPYVTKLGLFALRDLVPNFLIRSRKATFAHPDGAMILQLRQDHRGQTRP